MCGGGLITSKYWYCLEAGTTKGAITGSGLDLAFVDAKLLGDNFFNTLLDIFHLFNLP